MICTEYGGVPPVIVIPHSWHVLSADSVTLAVILGRLSGSLGMHESELPSTEFGSL